MTHERAKDVPDSSNDMILGEMRGQLREVVHSVNNLSQNVTALTREVAGLGTLAVDVATLKIDIAALKEDRNRREGASGVFLAISKSPAMGWLVGAAVAFWALLNGGKINP